MARRYAERRNAIPRLAEIFRRRGYAGASLAEITEATGLGKGSLYHFFPDGKDEMALAVIDDIAGWFETHVFAPLREETNPTAAIKRMFDAVIEFFHAGRRVCLIGTFALDDTRDRFAEEVESYFAAWIFALTGALKRSGFDARNAAALAEEVIAGLQGALVLARATHDPEVFIRAVDRLRRRCRPAG